MKLAPINPSKSLNKAYFAQSVTREQIELFKKELQKTFAYIDEKQDEEYHKNIIADLFKNVYCKDKYLVNVNKKEDLVIRLGNKTTDDVGVLLEFKKPTEKRDMVTAAKANVKALQETVLYYLRQTVDTENHKITNIVVTNIYEWFIFDGVWFEKNIFRNTKLKKEYLDFKTSGHDTKYFYDTIAAKYLAEFKDDVPCTYFNLLDYKKIIDDNNLQNDNDLINLYKILSPEHLLNKKFANDSNSLNTDFYNELLYIIGLEESKDTAKKTIQRINEAERNEGSLIENTIAKLKTKKYFGFENSQETENKYYEIALELCITWLNRILFLKLLESQLIKYHRGDAENYAFLSYSKIRDFDELEELFFEVLAEKVADRKSSVASKYKDIPYLNSSLFEMTNLEKNALSLSNLKDRLEFAVYKKSVLKKGTKETIKPKTSLNYLLDFLDAYNFASESNAKIQEENKSIINAAVLGLIFEKINGYKDGSFFTPGFITMYMCHETIRKAVVQKFKTNFPNCQNIIDFEEIKDKLDHTNKDQRLAANKLINDIKIVDPAVGSGHFLVSALNEMIAIKSDLQILSYANGNRVLGYTITLDNDELIIQNQETNKLFEYTLNQNNNVIPDLQNLQECLFTEKQIIIENCLFGVDINPKSVMICQLRLWIELLKNAYYISPPTPKGGSNTLSTNLATPPLGVGGLQTLPNIDINIKTGNSLISKFAIKDNIFERITGFQKKLQEYKNWVAIYKNTNDKSAKNQIKQNLQLFKDSFHLVDPRLLKLDKDLKKVEFEHYDKYGTFKMFQSELTLEQEVDKSRLEREIQNQKNAIIALKDNPIYENAFEWRFEFPEVLDDKGDFIGFDVVIGNPPYISSRDFDENLKSYKEYYLKNYFVAEYQLDLFHLFFELSDKISNKYFSYIIPNTWLANHNTGKIRKFTLDKFNIQNIVFSKQKIFEEANVDVIIIECLKKDYLNITNNKIFITEIVDSKIIEDKLIAQELFENETNFVFNIFTSTFSYNLISKIENNCYLISDLFEVNRGIHAYRKDGYGKSKFTDGFQTEKDYIEKSYHSNIKIDDTYVKEVKGKHVFPYYNIESNIFVSYGNWLAEPRVINYFKGNRIYLRKILGRNGLISNFIDSDIIADQSLYIAKSKNKFDVDEKFVIAILNSKMIGTYFRLKYNEFDDLFPQIKVIEFKNLPIKRASEKIQKPIISLVDQILTLKKENPKADTSDLENDIDTLVYALYELTAEEIAVVENKN